MKSNSIRELVEAVNRLAAAVEHAGSFSDALGQTCQPRYTRDAVDQNTVVGEKTMADLLGISPRTLAEHRRLGRLPGCWVKNGRRVCWMPEKTIEAWKRGIA